MQFNIILSCIFFFYFARYKQRLQAADESASYVGKLAAAISQETAAKSNIDNININIAFNHDKLQGDISNYQDQLQSLPETEKYTYTRFWTKKSKTRPNPQIDSIKRKVIVLRFVLLLAPPFFGCGSCMWVPWIFSVISFILKN